MSLSKPGKTPSSSLHTSSRISEVRYEIRGELAQRALELEAAGRAIVKVNIGNPGVFGFTVPEHVREVLRANLASSETYSHQKGILPAREAIVTQQHEHGVVDAHVDRVFIGNGVSELIDLSLRALLNDGDEVLLPSPDYPLWSAATVLNGGKPVYYTCPAERGHVPDPAEIEAAVTSRTRAIVVVNPNNPTGAVYPRAVLEAIVAIAEQHGLVILSDEIYDEIVYDKAEFVPLAKISRQVPCLTFDGLSKVQRACGYRVGWLSLTGAAAEIGDIERALDLLASLRLCANVPGQWAIPPSLTGPDTISPLTAPGGRLFETRQAVIDACAQSRFLDVVAPRGALYAFPSIRADILPAFNDDVFALALLEQEGVLVVPGRGFNYAPRNHFRTTLLPLAPQMRDVFVRIERVLERMAASALAPQRQVA
jgi:alanine-synthesizing transaminase